MPGFLLHLGATVQCVHGGVAQPLVVSPHVQVSAQPVVVQTAATLAGCTLPPPPAANGPCLTAQFVSEATKVFADGLPVLLLDSQAICAPTGTPLLITVTQTKVVGM